MENKTNQPQLTPRLRAVASMVRGGARVADIGTDHAYLPVWLVKTGLCPRCIACDVRQGPLLRAKNTVQRYAAGGEVALRLSDGLDAVRADEADDIVVAGMGGELIARILERCPWVKDGAKRLVLQPMTAQPELRLALCSMGFETEREAVAREGEKLYLVISAVYTGRVLQPSALYLYAGRLAENRDEESAAWLRHQAAALLNRARGQRLSGRLSSEAEENERLARQLLALVEP